MKIMSLFANIGVAEAYLEDIGFEVVVANEIDPKRVAIYQEIYPTCDMVCGDITKEETVNILVKKAKEYNVDIVMATPPCQGMSTAGKQEEFDERNSLICDAVRIIKEIKPKYVMLENVPMQLLTRVRYNEELLLIPDYLKAELGDNYDFVQEVIDTADYGVPQTRERAIFLLTRKDVNKKWKFPDKEDKKVTLLDAIGDLPILDPLVYDVPYEEHLEIFPNYEDNLKKAMEISKWHIPPKHVKRQVITMMHTPTGETAFNNKDKYKPKKQDGTPVKGYKNTYKRQNWDSPAYTVTMYNRTISSQNNVHPGRFIGTDINGDALYSDPRVLTVYELMLIMSLPSNWPIPENTTEHFIRSVLGEGIPPLFVKKLFLKLH